MEFQYHNPIKFVFGVHGLEQTADICRGHRVMLVYWKPSERYCKRLFQDGIEGAAGEFSLDEMYDMIQECYQ